MRVIMKPLRRTLVFFIFSVFLCGTVSARQIEWQSCMTSPYSDWFGTESSSPELLC
ncbi:alpha/beta hydrolase, partial [Escherichia coli]